MTIWKYISMYNQMKEPLFPIILQYGRIHALKQTQNSHDLFAWITHKLTDVLRYLYYTVRARQHAGRLRVTSVTHGPGQQETRDRDCERSWPAHLTSLSHDSDQMVG